MKLFKNLLNEGTKIVQNVTNDPFEYKSTITSINNGTIQCDITSSIRKNDRTKGTTFTYETNFYKSSRQTNYPLVLMKKLKNFNHHPALPKIYEMKESGSKVIITTEEMYPIADKISEIRKIPDLLIWAVLNVIRGVDYLHSKGILHCNVKPQSLYVTKALEVKLFGLEYLTESSSLKDSPFENRLQTDPQVLDDIYLPPDPMNYRTNAAGVDSWGVAATLCYLFGTNPQKKSQVAQSPSIPMELANYHRSICSMNHSERQSVSTLLKEPIISQNRFLGIVNVLEKFSTVDVHQRDNFLRNLASNYDSFPPTFRQFKLLESFLEIMSGRNEATTVVEPTMKLVKNLSQEDFDSDVLPTIKTLLQSGTQQIKAALLAQAHLYVAKLPENVVSHYLYPMLTKSMDKDAPGNMKDAAIRSLVCLSPKLPESTINGEIYRFLETCLIDKESIVRINCVVCIGKIAKHFEERKRAELVTKAFTKSMEDNLADMKKAAYLMISQNKYIIDPQTVARQICPYVARALCDLDPQVRKAAIDCWDVISITAREYAYTIDNPTYTPKYPKEGQEISLGVGGHSSGPMQMNLPLFGGQSTTFTAQSAAPAPQKQQPVKKEEPKQQEPEKQQPQQTQQKQSSYKDPKPQPTVKADDWDSWAASFEQQTKTRQPAIAYGNYTSQPVQPKPQPKPQPPKKKANDGWGFDFDSDFGGSSGNMPSFI